LSQECTSGAIKRRRKDKEGFGADHWENIKFLAQNNLNIRIIWIGDLIPLIQDYNNKNESNIR